MANNTGKKYGGRKAGTPNKITLETKEILCNIINDEMKTLSKKLNELETKDRLTIITKLLPYILPKQSDQMNLEHKEETIRLKYVDDVPLQPNKIEFKVIE